MNTGSKDKAAVPVPPPLFFIACLGIGLVLEYFIPSRPVGWPWYPRIMAGGILSLASGLLALSAFIELIRNKTPFDPAKPTVRIVQKGAFRYSRHPMYLSLLLLLSGVAIMICSIWLLASIPILFIILEIFAVMPEEKYLLEKFGDEYMNYRSSVRRWI